MKSSRSFLWCAGLAASLLVVGACGPKKSDVVVPEDISNKPASTTAKADPPTDIKQPPRPAVEGDDTPLVDLETEAADKKVRDQGLIGDVYFDFDKYDLKPEARERLSKNADFMKQNPRFVVEIQGHCDERGTNDYNIALADRRANAALEYMVTLGVPATRLKTVSFGEERPTCNDHNESCWWKNRRGEFHLAGKS